MINYFYAGKAFTYFTHWKPGCELSKHSGGWYVTVYWLRWCVQFGHDRKSD